MVASQIARFSGSGAPDAQWPCDDIVTVQDGHLTDGKLKVHYKHPGPIEIADEGFFGGHTLHTSSQRRSEGLSHIGRIGSRVLFEWTIGTEYKLLFLSRLFKRHVLHPSCRDPPGFVGLQYLDKPVEHYRCPCINELRPQRKKRKASRP